MQRSDTIPDTHRTATGSPEHKTAPAMAGTARALAGVLALFWICSPALALPASPRQGGAAHFLQGVPVFWPYHAGLMITGFVLLFSGIIVAHYHKTGNWYRTHALLQTCGAACIIAGMAIGVYMVSLSGLPHLRNSHEVLGVVTGILVVVTLVLGYSIRRVQRKAPVRAAHRWMGRLIIVLMALTMLLGAFVLSLLLGV